MRKLLRCLFGLNRRDACNVEPIVSLRIPGVISSTRCSRDGYGEMAANSATGTKIGC